MRTAVSQSWPAPADGDAAPGSAARPRHHTPRPRARPTRRAGRRAAAPRARAVAAAGAPAPAAAAHAAWRRAEPGRARARRPVRAGTEAGRADRDSPSGRRCAARRSGRRPAPPGPAAPRAARASPRPRRSTRAPRYVVAYGPHASVTVRPFAPAIPAKRTRPAHAARTGDPRAAPITIPRRAPRSNGARASYLKARTTGPWAGHDQDAAAPAAGAASTSVRTTRSTTPTVRRPRRISARRVRAGAGSAQSRHTAGAASSSIRLPMGPPRRSGGRPRARDPTRPPCPPRRGGPRGRRGPRAAPARRMGLARRRERILHADVELLRARPEPDAPARAQRLGLLDLGQAEELAEEAARLGLTAAWPASCTWSRPSMNLLRGVGERPVQLVRRHAGQLGHDARRGPRLRARVDEAAQRRRRPAPSSPVASAAAPTTSTTSPLGARPA